MSYSYYSGTDLLYIIPEIYEVQPENSTVFIVSPWLNLKIKLLQPWDLASIKLIDLIKKKMDIGIETEVYISTKANEDLSTKDSIRLMEENHIKYNIVKGLHAKAIIGKYIVYKGSANLTYSALYENKETVELYETKDPLSELRSIL